MTTVLSELREMDDDELVTRLVEDRQELFNLRFQHVTGQLDNYSRLGQVRKEIARINTLLREREIAAAEAGEAGEEAQEPEAEAEESPGAADARRARVLGSRRAAARAAKAEGAKENESGSDER